jgi:hypothetical protein
MVLLLKANQEERIFKEIIMPVLKIGGKTIEELKGLLDKNELRQQRGIAERAADREARRDKIDAALGRGTKTGNIASRVDFSNDRMGPNMSKVIAPRRMPVPMKEGEYGNVNREGNPEAIGPDMGRVNKEAAKAARDFTAMEMAQNLMSPGYNKKKGGAIKVKKMASGGKTSQLAKANGCAVRGKSKGRIV